MLLQHKLIFIKAFAITTINSDSDLNSIITKYDELMNGEQPVENDISEIFNMAINTVKSNYSNRRYELIDLLIIKFPQWKKDFLIKKTNLYYGDNNLQSALDTISSCITEFDLDQNSVLAKLNILMSLDYDKNETEIESLMEYLKQQALQ